MKVLRVRPLSPLKNRPEMKQGMMEQRENLPSLRTLQWKDSKVFTSHLVKSGPVTKVADKSLRTQKANCSASQEKNLNQASLDPLQMKQENLSKDISLKVVKSGPVKI